MSPGGPPTSGGDWRRWGAAFVYVLAALALWSTVVLATAGILGVIFPGANTWLISSGSMAPAIDAGDLVITSAPPEGKTLAAPTVVTFEVDGRVYTHRIVDTVNDGSGWAYVTQGDANPDPDSTPVPAEDVLGVGRIVIPYIGLPVVWAQAGSLWKVAAFVLVLGAAIWIVTRWFPDDDETAGSEPEKATLAHSLGVGALLIGLAVTVAVAYSAFTASTAEAMTVDAGTGFRAPYATEILSDGPAGYWRLGETVTASSFDDDFTSFTGWNTFSSGDVQAAVGTQPDGSSGGLLEKINNNDPNGGWKDMGITIDDYTFEVWIYRPSPPPGGQADRIGIETVGFDGYSLGVNHGANRMWVERRNGGSPSTNVTGNITVDPPEDAWYRMVMSKNGSSFTLEMYDQGGILLASGSGSDTAHAGGFSRLVVHGGHNYFIDDVSVTGSGSVPPANDESGNANHGTYVLPATLGAPPLIGGDPDTAVDFGGGGVDVATDPTINQGSRPSKSLSVWFDVTDAAARQMIWEEGGTVNGLNLYLFGGQIYGRAWGDSAGWSNDLQVNVPISTGIHHAGLVLDATGGRLDLYIDGQLVGFDTKSDSGQFPSHIDPNAIGRVSNGTRFHDGNSTATAPYDGRIDEVAVFNSVLSAGRIGEHHANGTG